MRSEIPEAGLEPLSQAAAALGCDPAILAAILHRESGHLSGAARLAARRFEPHVFRRLGGGLAATHAGAAKLDPELAEQASSHGAPQIMGHHAKMLGYASASAMRAAFLAGGWPEQIQAMRLYAEKSGMASALRALDIREIARIYNGPAFEAHGYHLRLAADYARISGKAPARVLRRGSEGDDVAFLQARLVELGAEVSVDRVFGPQTEKAVRTVQEARGLPVDGVVGERTWTALGLTGFEPALERPPSRVELDLERIRRHRGKLTALLGGLLAAREEIASWFAALGVEPAAAFARASSLLPDISPEQWLLAAIVALLLWRELSPWRRRS